MPPTAAHVSEAKPHATSQSSSNAGIDPISRDLISLLQKQDPDVAAILSNEANRQSTTLELIASENHVSTAVMHAMGTWMTNKYAEGYPGKRYYGGCQFHDQAEDLARERAKKLFGCKFANVQPHCGANANIAAFMAMCDPWRHHPLAADQERRASFARLEAEFLRDVLQDRGLRPRSQDRNARLRRDPQTRAAAQAEDDHLRLQRVSAHDRLRRVPQDRR